MTSPFGVIADDFTGACDVGVQFRKAGLETVVLTDAERLVHFEGEFDVVVVDTESRNVSPELAYSRVRDAVKALKKVGAKLVYKKVDSTLRGNVGAELDAVMDELRVGTVGVAPSFPVQNRTVVDGRMLVKDIPLGRTEFTSHRFGESHIPTLIGRQTRRRIGHVALGQVRGGVDSVRHEIRRLFEHGAEVIVVDAETEEDLAEIAAASMDSNILPCGSAGLAKYVSGLLTSRSRVLVISGSVKSVTLDQIETAEKELRAEVLEPDLSGVISDDETLENVVESLVEAAEEALAEGRDVIVRLAVSRDVIAGLHKLGKELGVGSRQVKERIASALSESSKKIMAAQKFAGLILVGGDTSIAVVSALGAEGIRLEDEVLPGIPRGRIIGGRHEGMRVITKAGGFGDSFTLVKLIESMKSSA